MCFSCIWNCSCKWLLAAENLCPFSISSCIDEQWCLIALMLEKASRTPKKLYRVYSLNIYIYRFYRWSKWTQVRLNAATLLFCQSSSVSWVVVIPVASQGWVFGTWHLIHSGKQVEVFMTCGQAQYSKSRNWKLCHSFPVSWGHYFSSSLLHGWANNFPPNKKMNPYRNL